MSEDITNLPISMMFDDVWLVWLSCSGEIQWLFFCPTACLCKIANIDTHSWSHYLNMMIIFIPINRQIQSYIILIEPLSQHEHNISQHYVKKTCATRQVERKTSGSSWVGRPSPFLCFFSPLLHHLIIIHLAFPKISPWCSHHIPITQLAFQNVW